MTRKPGASGPYFDDEAIRAALRARVAVELRGQDVAIIEELGIRRGQTFVDVAIVNGEIHGYEIKSDRDSLRRLASQVTAYSEVLDRATLIVGRHHVDSARSVVPRWWGIIMAIEIAGAPHLVELRPGRENPRTKIRAAVELIWADEALALLDACGAARGYRGKPRELLWDRLCELYSEEELAHYVRELLKVRAAERGLRTSPGSRSAQR